MTNMCEFLNILLLWALRRPTNVEASPDRCLYLGSPNIFLHAQPGLEYGDQHQYKTAPGVSVFSGGLVVFRTAPCAGSQALSRELAEMAGDCGR